MEQKYSTPVRWLLYILSFFSLLLGVIISVVLMMQDDEESKELAKNCLIALAVGLVFWVVCGVLSMVLGLLVFFVVGLGAYATTASVLLPIV